MSHGRHRHQPVIVGLSIATLWLSAGLALCQELTLGDAHRLREAGKNAEALAAYRQVVESVNTSPLDRGGAELWVAHLLRERGQPEQALAAYRKMEARRDAHPHDRGCALLWISHLLREARQASEAREAYAKASGMYAAHPHDRGCALVWLAELQVEAKDFVIARDLLASTLPLKGAHENDVMRANGLLKKFPPPAQPDKEASEQAVQNGYRSNGNGQGEAAMVSFVRALELAGTPTQAARARNQIAFLWKSRGRAEEARVLLRLSLESRGADGASQAEAQHLLAHSWIDQQNWEEAYPAWEKLLEMPDLWDGARSEAYMVVGSGKLEKKKYPEARALFQKCVDYPKGDPWQKWESQASIARSYREEGNIAAAVAALEVLLKMDGLDAGRRKKAEDLLIEMRK